VDSLERGTMSDREKASSAKKPYAQPVFSRKSIDEVTALLRRNILDTADEFGMDFSGTQPKAPTLLVEAYEGKIPSLGSTERIPARDLQQGSIVNPGELVEVRLVEEGTPAGPEKILLWDVRRRGHGKRGLLETIGEPNLTDGVPLVVFVDSIADFQGSGRIDSTHCWQSNRPQNSDELILAMRSFFQFCTSLVKGALHENCPIMETCKDYRNSYASR
jgi:hypothetical protein